MRVQTPIETGQKTNSKGNLEFFALCVLGVTVCPRSLNWARVKNSGLLFNFGK